MQRVIHDINDELIFTNHDGYIFHDSLGFESGSQEELKIIQEFVRSKAQQKQLRNRLHAIWFVFCVSTVVNSQGHGYFSGFAFRWIMIGHRWILDTLRQFARTTMV